eukprot:TRINITY_DN8643_c0_g1_i1.p1 TRINITY_DN8643_c0_g1~~TRINITY_DN8643_c0_g1_i1.p1  ORF type:complete len:282 (+),score=83.32 TRINITY_DN8643_c0_g1_i1:89-934(+)
MATLALGGNGMGEECILQTKTAGLDRKGKGLQTQPILENDEVLQLQQECQELLERRLAIEEEFACRSKTAVAVEARQAAILQKSRQKLQQQAEAACRGQELCLQLERQVFKLRAEDMGLSQEVEFLEMRCNGQKAQLAKAEQALADVRQKSMAESAHREVDCLRQQRTELEMRCKELSSKAEQWQAILDFRQRRAEEWDANAQELELRCEELRLDATDLRGRASCPGVAFNEKESKQLNAELATAEEQLHAIRRLRQVAALAPILASLLASLWWQVIYPSL